MVLMCILRNTKLRRLGYNDDVVMGTIAVQSDTRQVGKSRWQGLRTTLVALLIISLIATVIFVVGFFVPGAIVAAMFVGLFYGLLVAVRVLDRPARGSEAEAAAARAAETEPEVHDFSPDIPRPVIVAERAGCAEALASRYGREAVLATWPRT